MSKFDLSTYKHLCILYPGGGAGNHISNLISTIPGFTPLFSHTHSSYIDSLATKYFNISQLGRDIFFKTHVSTINPLEQIRSNPEYLNVLKNNTNTNIIYGHWASFQQNLLNNLFVDLDKCVWLIVSWPTEGSVALRRIDKHNLYPQQPEKYNLPLDIELNVEDYEPPVVLANENNGFILDIDKFFSFTGWDYLNSKLQENLGIELPPASKKLHNIWYPRLLIDLES